MSEERIGTFTGPGKALRGTEVVAILNYHLEIYRQFIEHRTLSSSGRIPGMLRIEGSVRGGKIPFGETLTLVTKEGHTMEFFAKNTYGSIMAAGPLLTNLGEPVYPA